MRIHPNYIRTVAHEDFSNEQVRVMPLNRVPSLQEIVEQFESGRPIDTTLDRHLAFNPEERMPCYRKGYDLVDAWHDLHSMKASIDEANESIKNAQMNRSEKDLAVTPTPSPEQVPTE